MALGRKPFWDERILPRLDEIKGWCRDGYTDDQIADALGIHRSTFYRYKAVKSDLADALKINKEIADLTVENSLYKRATGLTITETTEEAEYIVGDDGKAKATGRVKRRKVIKEIPPDPTSCFFWLQNRKRKKWMDRKSIELTGEGGGPVQTVSLSKKQYIKIREQMLADDDC